MADHVATVDSGVGGEERREPVRAGDVEHPIGTPFGDCRQLTHGDRQKIAHEPKRSTMEVATRFHATIGKDHRVVNRRVEFALSDRPSVGDRVEGGAVDLGCTAQRVGILHTPIASPVTGNNWRIGE